MLTKVTLSNLLVNFGKDILIKKSEKVMTIKKVAGGIGLNMAHNYSITDKQSKHYELKKNTFLTMKKIILILALILSQIAIAQDFDFGDINQDYTEESKKDECKTPFTECWCETRPNHPFCKDKDTPAAPIDSVRFVALALGIAIGYGFCKLKNK